METMHVNDLHTTFHDHCELDDNGREGIIHDIHLDATLKGKDKTKEKVNTKALPNSAITYEVEKFDKNLLILIVVSNDISNSLMVGRDKDVEALRSTFEKLNFKVKMTNKDEAEEELKTLGTTDFTDYGCIAVAVLTYGNDGALRSNSSYDEKTIMKNLTVQHNPTLFTKPRILIMQTCLDVGPDDVALPEKKIRKHNDDIYYIPTQPDFLIFHSSYMGKPSYTDQSGSWFIQTLCAKINEQPHRMLMEDIVMQVQRAVAIDRERMIFNKDTNKNQIFKQIPVVTCTLIRQLYLYKQSNHDSAYVSLSSAKKQLWPSTNKSSALKPPAYLKNEESSGDNSKLNNLLRSAELRRRNKKNNNNEEIDSKMQNPDSMGSNEITQVDKLRSEGDKFSAEKLEKMKKIIRDMERNWAI